MSTETRYRAKYDFAASGKGMLTFKVGDRFILVSRTSDDWLTVKSMAGDMGLAPASYLEAIQVREWRGHRVCVCVCVCVCEPCSQDPYTVCFSCIVHSLVPRRKETFLYMGRSLGT